MCCRILASYSIGKARAFATAKSCAREPKARSRSARQPSKRMPPAAQAAYAAGWPHANTTLSKLHVFGLHPRFDHVVYLDADAMPLANLDHLFSAPLSAADYPFAAAPELMPPDTFNAGVMVVRPSAAAHAALLAAAASGRHDGTDQGVLNAHFAGWCAARAIRACVVRAQHRACDDFQHFPRACADAFANKRAPRVEDRSWWRARLRALSARAHARMRAPRV